MNFTRILTVLWIAIVCSPASWAGVVKNLYVGEVTVKGQGGDERKGAIGMAFRDVLVKVTGDQNIVADPRLSPMLSQPERFVQQYRYRYANNAANRDQDKASRLLKLWVRFDGEAIERSLNQSGVAIWSKLRPDVLVWLVVEESGQRFVLGAETLPQFREILLTHSNRRGLPIIIPMFDLQDQTRVRLSDLWGAFEEPVKDASKRYNTDAVLVGRISKAWNQGWEGRWTLINRDRTESWVSNSRDILDSVAGGIDGATNFLAAQKTSTNMDATAIELAIQDVRNLYHYTLATSYIKSIDVIDSFRVKNVNGTVVTFLVNFKGNPELLSRILERGSRLASVKDLSDNNPSEEDPSAAQRMVYRLLP